MSRPQRCCLLGLSLVLCLNSIADGQDSQFKPAEGEGESDDAVAQILEMHQLKAPHEESILGSPASPRPDTDFGSSFGASFLMILACEVGDKTFFIAAIMSMRHSQSIVFAGAICALAVMTVMGVALGWMVPLLIPVIYTYYISIVLFIFFGLQLLRDAYQADSEGFEELEEVEAELGKKDDDHDPEAPQEVSKAPVVFFLERLVSPVFAQAATMTFIAEWGDRSQIATIALGAQKEPFGVVFGGIAGHCICTGIAVIGGKMVSNHISERSVALVGGFVFLGFGAMTAWLGPESS